MPPKKAAATKASAAPAAKKAAPAKKSAGVNKPAAPAKKTAAAKPKSAPAKAAPAKTAATKAAPKKRKVAEEPEPEEEDEDSEEEEEKPAAKGSRKSAPPATKKSSTPVPAPKRAASAQPKKAKADATKKKTPAPEPEADKENAAPEPKVTGASSPTKRKREDTVEPSHDRNAAKDENEAEEKPAPEREIKQPRPVKRVRTAAPVSKVKIGAKINNAPEAVLDVFVFGEGSSGELGLGSMKYENKKPIDVKRPRINHNLSADKVGVVQLACGGMHAVALTKDNKVLTWGVNDQGALGRDTTWDGGLRDADAEDSDSDDEGDDSGLNPVESTPAEIDMSEVAEGTRFVQVAASDSASFALTEDGRVYGWGTFRASDGVLGFTPTIKIQKFPTLLPEPKKVVQIAAGSNHAMALDSAGKLFTWGCPEQNQLGRRCVQRELLASALRPGGVGLKRGVKVVKISCGSYHSFAVDKEGGVYTWGLNNFGQLAIEQDAGDSDAAVLTAVKVESLKDYKIADIAGGEHHSLACTTDGQLLVWGRIDGHQTGLPLDAFTEENAIYDDYKKPRILKTPTVIPGLPKIVSVAAGTDNSFAISDDGKVYSWGFSINYQTGQGTSDDVETPTLIDNTAIRDRKITYAGAGGQYSVVACHAEKKA
ncbi:hypothetical protein PpBr36_08745 [Pyricularia pennisetigena]|uniref:hypothetical protein n=1 Tax=Pyricularia pennisetigena TaxID=1578925 RepID=UPI0011537591|nr:hypothetical protein PpBr36_08745 [Pyricularia pennisetigena]TLS23936.1 hypothetical protein PpBr36_08745 [Pyricularia pennisetigena]